jgi:hypothetical protein
MATYVAIVTPEEIEVAETADIFITIGKPEWDARRQKVCNTRSSCLFRGLPPSAAHRELVDLAGDRLHVGPRPASVSL